MASWRGACWIIATACVGLLLPGEAGADPGSQWGEAAEAEGAAEPAEGAEADDVRIDEESEEPAPKPKAKRGPPKKQTKQKKTKKTKKRLAKDAQAEFEEATRSGDRALERRRRAEERAAERVEGGAPLEAARDLAAIAEFDDDPALMTDAAEAALEGVGTVAGAEETTRIHASAAQKRIEALRTSDDEYALLRLGLEEDDLRQLEVRAKAASTRASVAAARAEREDVRSRTLRIGKGEVISGAVLAGLGAGGLAMMGNGIYLGLAADRELEAAGVQELGELSPEQREPFERQYERASTLTAGGAVLGAVGTALGVTLIATGVRDLKRAGWRSGKRASLRGAPTVGRGSAGFVIGGRF